MNFSAIIVILLSAWAGNKLWKSTTSPTARFITIGLLFMIVIGLW